MRRRLNPAYRRAKPFCFVTAPTPAEIDALREKLGEPYTITKEGVAIYKRRAIKPVNR